MSMTLQQVADLIGGVLVGDPQTKVMGVATIMCARPDDLTFAKTPKLIARLSDCQASAAIVPLDVQDVPIPCIRVVDVVESFEKVAARFHPPIERRQIGVSSQAWISPSATLGENVNIYPGAYIGDDVNIGDDTTIFPGVCILESCQVGSDVTIFPNAVLYERTIVGDGTLVHAGAVLGANGFGYDSSAAGHQMSPQFGNVEIGQQVEIGACTTIDRATFGCTRVGDGSKLDNQVMIGHNCSIGKHNLLCSQVGIAGSCQTGDFVVMAGQVGIGDHCTIGDHVVLGAKSGVMHDLESGRTYLGAPAIPVKEEFQILAIRAKLPEIRKQLKNLDKQVRQLQSQQATQVNSAAASTDKAA